MEVIRNALITVARLLTVMERQAGNQVPPGGDGGGCGTVDGGSCDDWDHGG